MKTYIWIPSRVAAKKPAEYKGLLLQDYRNRSGLYQVTVADIIGVSPPTVSQWESGKRQPSLKHLKKLSKLYGCTLDDLAHAVCRR